MTDLKKSILETIAASPGQKVKVAVTDVDGILRGKVVHFEKFRSLIEGGFGFCNVVFGWDSNDTCYDNTEYTGWHTGYPDALARVDLNTFRRVPWEENLPFFLADFYDADNQPLSVCPRQLLKSVRERAFKMGFAPFFSQEFEWFNFAETSGSLAAKGYVNPKPLTEGMFGYSLVRASQNSAFFNTLFDGMRDFGVPIEGLHTETGPGVYEAAILYDDILEAADRATLFKTAAKEIGARHGVMPSFIAKWNPALPGCSGHVHQSLWDAQKSTNLFYDARDPHGMSDMMKSYLAGQLFCLPQILPFYAPNINSYKRLVEGAWAPTTVTWGIDNRTTALRVIPGSPKSTRIETRVAGSDTNPYLAMAASLASGLYGIQKGLKLDVPMTQGSGYQDKRVVLPRDLNEATQVMKNSPVAHEIFGSGFLNHFVATREWEWRQYAKAVTDWEIKRYFEII